MFRCGHPSKKRGTAAHSKDFVKLLPGEILETFAGLAALARDQSLLAQAVSRTRLGTGLGNHGWTQMNTDDEDASLGINGATIRPGGDDAPGRITLMGNYTQTGEGRLEIELGGPQDGAIGIDGLSAGRRTWRDCWLSKRSSILYRPPDLSSPS